MLAAKATKRITPSWMRSLLGVSQDRRLFRNAAGVPGIPDDSRGSPRRDPLGQVLMQLRDEPRIASQKAA